MNKKKKTFKYPYTVHEKKDENPKMHDKSNNNSNVWLCGN